MTKLELLQQAVKRYKERTGHVNLLGSVEHNLCVELFPELEQCMEEYLESHMEHET